MSDIITIAATRNVRRLVHIHTDHFEPEVAIQKGLYRPRDVNQYLHNMRPFRPSLFFMPSFCCLLRPDVESPILAERSGDPVVFSEFSKNNDSAECARVASSCCDIHIHLHHELWTRNQCRGQKLVPRPQNNLNTKQERLRQWIIKESTPELDVGRLSMALAMYRRWLEKEVGTMDNWCFVHGCWALQASDDTICTIEDEIDRLMREGCRGDWSFPAGRNRCDPDILEPYTCVPIAGPKAYDKWEANPRTVDKVPILEERFLIWNSGRSAWWPSLDYRAEHVKKATTLESVLEHLHHDAPVIGDTLYLKTHAHSMDIHYLQNGWVSPLKWFRPIMEVIEKQCLAAGVEVQYQTVREFIQEHSAESPLPKSRADT